MADSEPTTGAGAGASDENVSASSDVSVPPHAEGFGENKDEYVVEKICGKKVVDGVPYYHIKWVGWDPSTNTWEPKSHLTGCEVLVAKFEKDLKLTNKKMGKSGLGGDGQPIRHGYYLKWPEAKTPLSVEGAIKIHNATCYLVKFKTGNPALDDDPNVADEKNSIFVSSSAARSAFPELLVKYFEQKVDWEDDESDGASII